MEYYSLCQENPESVLYISINQRNVIIEVLSYSDGEPG